ncbi:MAG: beta-ketoacyl synthase N-terminal-like domain-containing protein, partial [Actinomycetales bacterium]
MSSDAPAGRGSGADDPIVVTGLGATTPLGGDVPSTWEAMLAGRSGARPRTYDWVDMVPVQFACTIAVEPAEV